MCLQLKEEVGAPNKECVSRSSDTSSRGETSIVRARMERNQHLSILTDFHTDLRVYKGLKCTQPSQQTLSPLVSCSTLHLDLPSPISFGVAINRVAVLSHSACEAVLL